MDFLIQDLEILSSNKYVSCLKTLNSKSFLLNDDHLAIPSKCISNNSFTNKYVDDSNEPDKNIKQD